MHAERLLLETDGEGRLTHVPVLPCNARIEAIFLVLDAPPSLPRRPSARIAGRGQILGDLMAPLVPEADWDALK